MREKIKIYFKENKKLFIGFFTGIILVLILFILFKIATSDYDLTSCQARCYDKYYPNPFSFQRCINECHNKYKSKTNSSGSGVIPWQEVIEK